MSLKHESIDIDWERYNPDAFLSFDIGGSACKAIYRDKDSPQEVRCLYASRDQLDDLITTLKEKCVFPPGPGPHSITTCGIGCTLFFQKLNQELNITINNISETECFVKTLKSSISARNLTKFCYKYEKESIISGIEGGKCNLTKKLSSEKYSSQEDYSIDACKEETYSELREIESDKMYPCAILMLGSAFGWIELEEDGSYVLDGGSTNGGKAFLGLGKLLLQTDSYDEILKLAKKGNANSVDVSLTDLTPEAETNETDFYTEDNQGDIVIFPFGKVPSLKSTEIKREDVAAAFVNLTCNNLVDWVFLETLRRNTKNIFVCGGFALDPYIRHMMISALIRKRIRCTLGTGTDPGTQFYFIKNGNVFGALGAFLQQSDS